MATIVHFNISATDPDRARAFYEKAFGWTFVSLPAPMNYQLIETRDLEGGKGLGGGLVRREGASTPGVLNFVGVESIDQMTQKIESLGGRVIQPKQVVPNWGYFAVCVDTEDNQVGLFQEDEHAH